MVRRKLIHRVEGCARSYQSCDDRGLRWTTSHVMTKMYSATSRMMMEVCGGASH